MQVAWLSTSANQLGKTVQNICQALGGRISFGYESNNTDPGQNIDGVWIPSVTITAANTAQVVAIPVPLNGDRTPIGFLVMLKDRACDVYASSTMQSDWSPTQIKIAGTVENAVLTLFVF